MAGAPRGSVNLLAGGNGRLDITASGTITKLAGNQLVRTRAMYRDKGFITLVPDLAPDMKVGADGVLAGYRVSQNYADDVGAMVLHLRTIKRSPVVVIGPLASKILAAAVVVAKERTATTTPVTITPSTAHPRPWLRTAWWRPDLRAGIVLLTRRPGAPSAACRRRLPGGRRQGLQPSPRQGPQRQDLRDRNSRCARGSRPGDRRRG